MKETLNWHGAINGTNSDYKYWMDYPTEAIVVRSFSGSIFSYNVSNLANSSGVANYKKTWSTRAVVVSGERSLKKRKENEYNNEKNKKLY